MLIVFSTLQQHQTFHLKVATLEEGFDWLNALVATGYQLCSIYLVDEHSNIRLPVDAFDGQPMSGVFLSLAQQWQELLRPTVPPAKCPRGRAQWAQSRLELTQQRLHCCERNLELVSRHINQLEALLKRNNLGAVDLKAHYWALLTRLQLNQHRYQHQRLACLTKLGQLRKPSKSGNTSSID